MTDIILKITFATTAPKDALPVSAKNPALPANLNFT